MGDKSKCSKTRSSLTKGIELARCAGVGSSRSWAKGVIDWLSH